MKTLLIALSIAFMAMTVHAETATATSSDLKIMQEILSQAKASPQKANTSKDWMRRAEPQKTKLSPDALQKIEDRLQDAKMIGNEGAHGGDPYSLEFITLGQILDQVLAKVDASELAKYHFTAQSFSKAVSSVRVITVSKDDTILQGAEVDAINFPDKSTILVNSDRWRDLSLQNKTQLVMHEYFGILGVERDSFDVSIHFLAFTKKVTETVASNSKYSNLMVNVFYGQCEAVPALTSSEICEQGSQALQAAEICARGSAEAHCHLSGKAQCQFIETTYRAVIDSQFVGARYCQVLTIVK